MTDSEYSPISSLAIVSALLGCAGLLGLFAPEFAMLALSGIATGLAAGFRIRKYRLSGIRLARIGIALSLIFALLTPVWHVTRFNSEALPGHERIDFSSLDTANDQHLEQLVGKKVCLKGYAIPNRLLAMDTFLLSVDGSTKKSEKAVMVELPAGTTWNWQENAIAVSGCLFRVSTNNQDSEIPKYVFRASSVRTSKTRFGLAQRAPWNGC
jgi:hypothetical protein